METSTSPQKRRAPGASTRLRTVLITFVAGIILAQAIFVQSRAIPGAVVLTVVAMLGIAYLWLSDTRPGFQRSSIARAIRWGVWCMSAVTAALFILTWIS